MIARYYSFSLILGLLSLSFFKLVDSGSDLRQGKDYALFFAVKDYDEWTDLRNPIKDAKAIAADLEQNYGFRAEVVENPTLDEIGQKLEEYRQKTYAKDAQLLIFFSGHGEFVESTKEGFFIPKEGSLNDPFQRSYLPHSRLERAVTTIPCRHILLAIDACYSGTFDDYLAFGKGKLGDRPGEGKKSEQQRFIDRVLKYQSRLYLTSGGKERTPDGLDHSPFTLQFLTALRSFGGANKMLDFDELKSYMKEASPRPHAGQFEGHEPGGDFLFVLDDHPVQVKDLKQDLAAWQQAESLNTLRAYQNYLSRFPNGEFEDQAQVKVQEMEKEEALNRDILAWNRAKNLDTKPAYEAYLQDFPNGNFRILANSALNKLNTAVTPDVSNKGLPKDPSGRTYKTVELNGKTWLAENLDYDIGEGSWCYDDKAENCRTYGRLYTWEAAKKGCAALGAGWRLPTDVEWKKLAESVGGYYDWKTFKNVEDPKKGYQVLRKGGNSGFAALLGGFRNTDGEYVFLGRHGYYWSATGSDADKAWIYWFSGDVQRLDRNDFLKSFGRSCRCIQDY